MTFTYAPGWAEPLFVLFLFVLGLCFGSFLNVVIARVPEGLSIVRPGSRCPKCGHVLSWYENIPVLSWLGLRGKCRGCGMPISPRYVLVELLTGLLFLACLKRFDWTYALVPALVLVFLLVPLTFIDLEHWILPFSLTLPGIAAGVLLAIPQGADAVGQAALGAAVGFLSFRLMEYVGWRAFKREALGGGDKFLVALLGAFLGWQSLLGILFFASLQGSIVGVTLLALTGRAGPRGAPEAEAPDEAEEPESTMTWDFTKPGLPLWKRAVLVPWCLLFQPIPDSPLDETGEEEEWVPGPTNIPFGPWLALAGLELMLLGPVIAHVLPPEVAMMLGASR
ncbi:prepilin peptidase [Corallococcus aberystwythensis]|uniref:Prepilin leader peptidase/N-methyltransferase n=1 Tax=Corallococcus aberystwythensis TaxID=2316722 RepID=A0A3A8QSB2_9BACT|nr:A24 family peptidase [Corallococcus aberystwythensis]RKH71427.1 prepilin peptidase [Corallococcus aberystwythensis]